MYHADKTYASAQHVKSNVDGRERVRREVFKGKDAKGAHRTGSEGAALAVLAYAAAACGAYLVSPGISTGFLLGKLLMYKVCKAWCHAA